MGAPEIHLSDWGRIFIGSVPWIFFIELLFRAIFFYVLIIFSMRLMGKRMSSQLSRNEMASLVALAASIGIPLMAPDRGIIPGFISCMVIVLGQRTLSGLFSRNEKIEELTQGYATELVEDGVIKVEGLKEANISRDRVLAQLRSEGLKQLGQVRRLYFEKNGSFTLIKDPVNKTGLNILPEEDMEYVKKHKPVPGLYVCDNCGKTRKGNMNTCENCGNTNFTEAINEEAVAQ